MNREELAGWLRLTETPGVGRASARKLLAAFGLPSAIFAQPPAALRQVVEPAQVHALAREPQSLNPLVEQTFTWLQSASAEGIAHSIVTLGDPRYPASLLQTEDPPVLLYVLGAQGFELDQIEHSLAIVGSRNPSAQGDIDARAFARALVESGLTVLSGLALGIDGSAHEGALQARSAADQIATVAVVGTGLDRVYPPRHRELAHRIARRGLIVSEFALGTLPLAHNFPRRNRLIAGLTRGTLVVEAALQSGSLITARLAVEQGKDVFAIPGSIHAPQSHGCHALIRQGAKLVETVQDILEDLRWEAPVAAPAQERIGPAGAPRSSPALAAGKAAQAAGSTAHASLLDALGHAPVSLDALSARTGWDAPDLQARLLELELEGRVARLPGGLFQRVERA
ncbi:MAG: DNA-processing protein DprA [Burkholderiaceae bacterium]|nr:DNA-processing protein DprA [Burkholderiaceae bacterium]